MRNRMSPTYAVGVYAERVAENRPSEPDDSTSNLTLSAFALWWHDNHPGLTSVVDS